MRYRFDVVAANVIDVVKFAGGWLFDRAMAGWEVTVLVADHVHPRPLQILGAQIIDLQHALESAGQRLRPQTLAVAADLVRCDPRVRDGVLMALDRGITEVTLWGESWPAELDESVGLVHHRLSAAAKAFKAQALAAAPVLAGGETEIAPAETFRSPMMACRSVAADLVPAGAEDCTERDCLR